MYLGIDLGTSNSAVVGNIDGTTRLFKTADGSDVLPSVIYLDKRGHRFVGKSAQDRIMSAPANVAAGFKRLMGTKSPVRIGDQEWSPNGIGVRQAVQERPLPPQFHPSIGATSLQSQSDTP